MSNENSRKVTYTRAYSSVGQSGDLINPRPSVRARLSPPFIFMISCLHCNKIFNREKDFNLHQKKVKQGIRLRKEAIERYQLNPKICLLCNQIIPYKKSYNKKQRFCSQSCANRSTGRNKRSLVSCVFCSKGIKSDRKYCSNKCQSDFETNIIIQKWLSGEILGYGTTGMLKQSIKNYIKNRDGNKCVQCGWCEINPVTGNSPLHVDHVDGNWRNSRPENLRTLCPNCHSLTPTYGSLNRNGRGNTKAVRKVFA